ncbi:MAG: hypothetical protein MJZ52_05105, partial [Bacteroidales bacterium]|nr:hypothetical protein [Bacteroidales bacterium]
AKRSSRHNHPGLRPPLLLLCISDYFIFNPLDYTTKEGNYHHLLNLHTLLPSHAAVGHHAFTARAAPDIGNPARGTLYPPPSKRLA